MSASRTSNMLTSHYMGAPIASRGLWGTRPEDPPSMWHMVYHAYSRGFGRDTPQSPAGSNMQLQQNNETDVRNEAGGVQTQGRGGCENTMIVVMLILHPKYTPNHNNHRPISRSKRGRRWPIFKIWFFGCPCHLPHKQGS